MKKLGIIAVAMMIAGSAVASSLSVPWFVDEEKSGIGAPPSTMAVMGVIYLHNNLSTDKVCSIEYITSSGVSLGPYSPVNTFVIPAKATMAFRPGVNDANTTSNPAGQEPVIGSLVPDRPRVTSVPDGTGRKSNGSCQIVWDGGSGDVQGIYIQIQNVDGTRLLQYGTLLPPGVS